MASIRGFSRLLVHRWQCNQGGGLIWYHRRRVAAVRSVLAILAIGLVTVLVLVGGAWTTRSKDGISRHC
jgi:hypothetical protein